jgi:benzoyl-CoA reductase/2-hydroxyglutaryl-CoA dehydratase subunit BcrC/BadD/HgdB
VEVADFSSKSTLVKARLMGKKERSSAIILTGCLFARNTLEHIPLAANAVMIGSLGHTNQMPPAIIIKTTSQIII